MGEFTAIAIHTLRIDDSWRDGLPVLTGNLVQLREIAFEDAPSLHVLLASDPKVTEHISPPPPTVEALQGFIAWAHKQREAGKLVVYAVVPKGLKYAVGLFQVRKLQPDFMVAEWGFALGSSFWGTGVFEDAAVLVADFAFDTLGADRLEGRSVTGNLRGNAALQKIGATGEAVLRSALKRGNVLLSQYLWSLRSADWHTQRAVIHERFSPAALEDRIHAAVAEARRVQSAAAPAGKPTGDIPHHPFFVWDPTTKPPDDEH